MNFVVVPFRKLLRCELLLIDTLKKSESPLAGLVLDVRYQVRRKQTRAGHLRQLKKSAKQTRFTARKKKPIVIRRAISQPRKLEEVVPRVRRVIDPIGSVVQQPDIDIARQTKELSIDRCHLQYQRREVLQLLLVDDIVQRCEKTELRRRVFRVRGHQVIRHLRQRSEMPIQLGMVAGEADFDGNTRFLGERREAIVQRVVSRPAYQPDMQLAAHLSLFLQPLPGVRITTESATLHRSDIRNA